jgi:hypothetical protein
MRAVSWVLGQHTLFLLYVPIVRAVMGMDLTKGLYRGIETQGFIFMAAFAASNALIVGMYL